MLQRTFELGTLGDWHHGRIDHDAALAFARATDDPNPVYEAGGAVPPVFSGALTREAQALAHKAAIDPSLAPAYGVHAEHDVRFHAPLRPGMALQWRAGMDLIKQTPAGVLTSIRIIVCDRSEQILQEHRWSNIYVAAVTDHVAGLDLADHTFPAHARDHHLASHTFPIAADQGFRYGGASGDLVPHAIDDEQARAEGFPGKILQGMCSLAMCTGALVKYGADGDPTRITRLAARFAAPVIPKHDLEVHLYESVRGADQSRTIAFEATSNGVTVIKHGLADIQA